MQKVEVQVRLTHKYVDEWSHLDEWSNLDKGGQTFTVKLLGGKCVQPPKGYDDGGGYRYRVIGPKNVDQKALQRAITHTFNKWGCSHEHDCCGCLLTSARVDRVKRGIFTMLLRHSYNY